MTVETLPTQEKSQSRRARRIFGGSLMILFGLILLASRFMEVGVWLVLVPGLVMLAWGIFTRDSGWMIPAGVLNGIGLGIFAQEGPLALAGSDGQSGGLFLLCFALGWFSIPVFSMLFTRDRHLWALIPGGVMAFIGGMILLGDQGMRAFELLGYLFPAALIIVGLVIMFKKNRS